MSFANPWMLALFAPLAFAAWRLLRRGRKAGIKFSAVGRLPARTAGWRAKVAALTPFVLLAGLALLVIAAARPRSPLAHEQRSVDAIAIAMTVDVSGSMDALDLTPRGETFSRDTTRLAVVKKLFAKFVEKRPDDLIGLVTFGGYAATRSPLTADHEALLNVLRGVQIPSVALDAQGEAIGRDEQMTAVGDGLATALARLKDAKPKSKVVILLSDGVSNTGAVEPDAAADAAAKLGIKVYAIGVGTRSRRTPIFGRDFFGRPAVQYADMTFDEKQLKSIAAKTGGTYFPVNDNDGLQKALDEIDQLETTKLEADAYDRWEEHFTLFLLAGALLVLAAVSLSMSATRRMAALGAVLAFAAVEAVAADALVARGQAWFDAREGSWAHDGAWASGGAALTPAGAGLALGGATVDFTPAKSAPTADGIVRVETRAEILSATEEAMLPTDGEAFGRLALVKAADGSASLGWWALADGAWRPLTGGETSFGVYTLRIELDLSKQPRRVRYGVARDDGAFATLTLDGAAWLTVGETAATGVTSVELCGDASVGSLTGLSAQALVDDAFVAAHVAGADAMAADEVWAALVAPRTEGNALTLLESYALGLDPNEKGAVPTVCAVPSATAGKARLTFGNVAPDAASGVKVAYSLLTSATPDFAAAETSAAQASPTFEVESGDDSSVRYFRINAVVGD